MANSIFRHDKYGPWGPKDPAAKLDYGFNWSDWLATGETIASSVWSAETSGIGISSAYVSSPKTLIWVSGGSNGGTYWFRNQIWTNQNRSPVRRFRLKVSNR
jgi:hypothetical protein